MRAALASNNFTSAPGQVKGDFVQTNIDAKTSLDDPNAFKELVVMGRGDSLVRLGDIAEIELGPQNADSSSVFDGSKAVFIGVYATPTANPLTVITDVREAFPEIQKELPPGLTAAIAYDATNFIRASLWEVMKTMGEAAIIVIVVIFLFLGNFRSTFIPLVTIPLSLIGVLAALMALGYSINLMTLLALVLAIGLVVDDAIVVVENIYRHIEEGKRPLEAALLGAREIVYPVIAMTITLAAVFAPIGFVSGLTGALFAEFAFTLAGAVIVSGIIALTLSPMMCSKLLKAKKEGGEGRLAAWLDRRFESLKQRYQRRLHGTLNYRPVTMLMLAGLIAGTGLMYMTTKRELAPEEDQGILFSIVKTPQYANLDYLEDATQQLYKVYSSVAEKEHVFTINGMGDVHQGFAGLLLKPWGERERSQKDVLQELSPKITSIATAQALAFSPPALPGSVGGPPVQFVITTTHDFRELADVLADVREVGARKRHVHLLRLGPEIRDAADRVPHRPRQGQPARHHHGGYRWLARHLARRQLRQFVRPVRAELSGHPASTARVPAERGLAHALPDPHELRCARAALERRVGEEGGAAERAHQFPAAQLGDAFGRALPGPHRRRGHRFPEAEDGELPGRLHLRLPGREPAVRAGGQHARLHLHLRAGRDLPRACGAI